MNSKKFRKVYVAVEAEITRTGKILPRLLIWPDDRKYEIDSVKRVCCAPALKTGGIGDRYTVMINGHERDLFFEHNPDAYSAVLGRWFVEQEICEA